jgi:hypothetical protein
MVGGWLVVLYLRMNQIQINLFTFTVEVPFDDYSLPCGMCEEKNQYDLSIPYAHQSLSTTAKKDFSKTYRR